MKQHKSFSRRKFFTLGATSVAAFLSHKALAKPSSKEHIAPNTQAKTQTPRHLATALQMQTDKTLTEGDLVMTMGYHQIGDGGNNHYLVVKDPKLLVDGGTVIKLTSGFKAQALFPNDQVHIEQFGVIAGDKLTNQQIAQNSQAMNQAHQLNQVIHYGSKTYQFDTLTITQGGIQGQAGTKLISSNTNSAIVINHKQTANPIELTNFTLTCNTPTQTSGIISAKDLKVDLRITHVTFNQLKQGLVLTGGNNITLSHNQFSDIQNSNIEITGKLQTVNISQNQITTGQGAAIRIAPTQQINDLSINNNQINASTNKEKALAAIEIHNSQRFMINNNIINCNVGQGHRGIYISENCNSGILNANHIIQPQNGQILNLSKTTTLV